MKLELLSSIENHAMLKENDDCYEKKGLPKVSELLNAFEKK